MNSSKRDDEGFTGLEAAIVLIAFVVVAAVFSYVVLGAGFFTTQKAQETVHTGVPQTISAVEPSGPVSIYSADGQAVGNITFYLQLADGGAGVDMSKVVYAVSTPKKTLTFTNNTVNYSWVKSNGAAGSKNQWVHTGLLHPSEMVYVDVNPGFTKDEMGINDKFIVEVKPPVGAALHLARTVPDEMTTGTWYEVL